MSDEKKDENHDNIKFEKVEHMSEDLKTINNVEIFAAGTWNGDKYTIEDLDEMVRAFEDTGHKLKPFLKLGHNEEQKLLAKDGLPAAGWINNLRRIGDKLVADFVDIPKKVFDLIENKAFRKVSSEVWWNIEVAGKKFKRMLSAVALLGSDMPAVSSLDDILALYSIKGYDELKQYTINFNDEEKIMDEKKEFEQKLLESEKKAAQLELQKSELEKKYSEEIEAKNKEIETFKEKDLDNHVEKQCDELVKDGMPVSAKPYAFSILRKKAYKKDDKEISEFEALREILKLHSASSVNLEEGSQGGKKEDSEDSLDAEIQKYAKEHNVSYTDAYKALAK